MGQRAPTVGQIAVAVAFAFSCFGLLLFLWVTFGGPIPLKPEGYRIKVPFNEATHLGGHSAGDLQIGYALSMYGGSEREVTDGVADGSGRCGGTGFLDGV